MRAADPQKNHERLLVERFIESGGLTAEIVEERERPDFVIRIEGRLVGMEPTKLFVPYGQDRAARKQAQESISTRIVLRAREMYQASGGPPVHVNVVFNPVVDLRSVGRDTTAKHLVSFMQRQDLALGQNFAWRPADDDEDVLPDGISYIQALGVPTYELGRWSVVRAGWTAGLTADALQSRIDQKAHLLPSYQSSISENWLVIAADRTKPSGMFR